MYTVSYYLQSGDKRYAVCLHESPFRPGHSVSTVKQASKLSKRDISKLKAHMADKPDIYVTHSLKIEEV